MLELPPIEERYHYITLSQEERNRYDKTAADMSNWINHKAGLRADQRDHFGIFQVQLQLRLVCNQGTFQKPFQRRGRRDKLLEWEEFLYALGSSADIECSMCGIPVPAFDAAPPKLRHGCGHVICPECIPSDDQRSANKTSCLYCGGHISPKSDALTPNSGDDSNDKVDHFDLSGVSSKIEILIRDLQQTPRDTKRYVGSARLAEVLENQAYINSPSNVFSCWTRTLDLVALHLTRMRILHQRIDCRQTLAERQHTMSRFVSDEGTSVPVLLMTTGVGAFGYVPSPPTPRYPNLANHPTSRVSRLNLTAANHVYILEPQWNPSVESQALRRVARRGQKKTALVTRYLVHGTVEIV